MKKITVTMIALCIALVSGAALAKSSRVDVLHKPGTAAERTITISESALPAHCRHGDEVVGDDSGFSCEPPSGECENDLFVVGNPEDLDDFVVRVEVEGTICADQDIETVLTEFTVSFLDVMECLVQSSNTSGNNITVATLECLLVSS